MTPKVWFSPRLLRPCISSSAMRTLLVSFLCYIVAYAYCSRVFWRNPHSYFHDRSRVYDLEYSAVRESQAGSYIDFAERSPSPLLKASSSLQICAAFVTVKRTGKNYVDGAIGSMLEGLTDKERQKLYLYILFADTDPTKHDSWHEDWIRNSVDMVESYNVTAEKLEYLKELEEKKNFQEKGVFDYLYALDACYRTGAPYVAIFEDDIILADGWMIKTLNALHEIAHKSETPEDEFWNWIYLRLFFTENFMDWEAKYDFWWRNFKWTFVLASTAGLCLLIMARNLIPISRRWLDNLTIAIICLITIPAFIDLSFKAGKYSLFPPHGVFVMNNFGCCSQALVFPRAQVPGLADFLRNKNSGQTDSFIEEYSGANGLARLALAPQVVQHMGTVSSRGSTSEVSRSIFAYYFEANDAGKLRKQHDRLTAMMNYEE